MSKSLRSIILFAILGFSTVASPGAGLRESLNFNREWKFQLGDVTGADAKAFDDANWSNANLPHSFSLPYFASEIFYVGYGWYRKHFVLPATAAGKRINLEFDGVFQDAEIFVNGRRIGEHKGGYTGFTFDITDAVKDGDNVLAVRVNNLWNARLAPRAGEHTFSGGIYRNLRLVMTAPMHVAWYGTFVTTPQVSKQSGTVNVKTEVVNESDKDKVTTLLTRVLDANGRTVTEMNSTQTIAAKSTVTFDQTSRPIAHPKLWHPDHPYLYSVQTVVLDNGVPTDDFNSPLGFRWFKFTADQGFFLNGEHFYIKGANVHQDHAGWGDAVADSGFYRDVKLVKDGGFDFIRGSHYPHAPAFATACDELGVLFWSENCFWGIGGSKGDGYWNASAYPTNAADEAEFQASVKASLRDMIRINRNHPSIIVWSMSNEPFFSEPSVIPKMKSFLGDLVAYTHELDSTRPAAIGGAQRPQDENRIDKMGDLAGYNGDGATLPVFQNPGVPSLVSEYGSTMVFRPAKYAPGWDSLAKDNGQAVYPWRSGQAIWCAFDHGSIAGKKFGGMGIIDYFRLPKRSWYWYRNEYKHIPPPEWPGAGIPAALKLTADKTVLKSSDGTDDAQIIVTVVDQNGKTTSNSPQVKLVIESGPGEFPTGPDIAFAADSDITIADGQAAIEFRSYHAGKTVIRAISPGLKDAVIQITTTGGPEYIPGKTLPVMARPYAPYQGGQATNSMVRLGLNNPAQASSQSPDHSPALANDGNVSTCWQAAASDPHPWWRVDLEKLVTVAKTKLVFSAAGNWQYIIEISDDGNTGWKLLVDHTQTLEAQKERTDVLPNGSLSGRFLRVTFSGNSIGKPASLAEVEVSGTLTLAAR